MTWTSKIAVLFLVPEKVNGICNPVMGHQIQIQIFDGFYSALSSEACTTLTHVYTDVQT